MDFFFFACEFHQEQSVMWLEHPPCLDVTLRNDDLFVGILTATALPSCPQTRGVNIENQTQSEI